MLFLVLSVESRNGGESLKNDGSHFCLHQPIPPCPTLGKKKKNAPSCLQKNYERCNLEGEWVEHWDKTRKLGSISSSAPKLAVQPRPSRPPLWASGFSCEKREGSVRRLLSLLPALSNSPRAQFPEANNTGTLTLL